MANGFVNYKMKTVILRSYFIKMIKISSMLIDVNDNFGISNL